MRSRPIQRLWPLVAILFCLVVCAGAVAGAAVDAARSPSGDPATVPTIGTEQGAIVSVSNQVNTSGGAADNVLRLDVRADGSAAGTVVYRTRLDDANETAAFEELRTTIETNPQRYTASFTERMTASAAAAEVATGREMAIENVRVRAIRSGADGDPTGRYGIVTYTFVWQGFAATDGERLQVGDALSGFFLDTETRLVLSWPDGYTATSIRPPPDERRQNAAIWAAPTAFEGSEPGLVLAPTDAGAGGTAGSTPDGGTDGPSSEIGSGVLPTWVVFVALALVALAVFLVTMGRRNAIDDLDSAVGAIGAVGAVSARDDGEKRGTDGAKSGTETGDPGTDRTATDGVARGGDSPGEDGTVDPPLHDDSSDRSETTPTEAADDSLLSNEERVLRLLERREGRVKQREVAAELDWSAAKTSQVIRGLRRDGRVEGFRLGRENVLWVADDRNDSERRRAGAGDGNDGGGRPS